jgi:hypothetical protein
MYQVTMKTHKDGVEVLFMDRWSEVIDWVADLELGDKIQNPFEEYYTIALVFEGSLDTHTEFYPEDSKEKGNLINNMVKLLPDRMGQDEIVATIMTTASTYWNPDEMAQGFDTLSQIADTVKEQGKNAGHKRKLH